jgi:uncharacterized protein (TIGR02266 family)
VIDTVRRLPRFVHETRVEIRAADGEDLRTLWTRDISRGGLFVATDHPPPVDTMIELSLEVADGRKMTFAARVVYALDPARAADLGTASGAGIQLVGMTAAQRRAIEEYIERIAGEPFDTVDIRPPAARGASAAEIDALIEEAERIVDALYGGDLYAALEIDTRASCEQIDSRIRMMIHRFLHAPVRASSSRRMRLDGACAHLEKVRRLLADPDRRLEYDFRSGFADAETRIAAAATAAGPSVARLRDAWRRVFPDRLREAALRIGASERLERTVDLVAATREARAALVLDPFNEALRRRCDALEVRAHALRTHGGQDA